MLGKLLKYDFINTGKLLLPLNGLVIVMTLIGAAVNPIFNFRFGFTGTFLTLMLVTYIIALVGIVFLSNFYPAIYYYRNLFSNQGYLTFTLPVSPWATLCSKVIVAFVWSLVNLIITVFSVLFTSGYPRTWQFNFGNQLHDVSINMENTIGYGFTAVVLIAILLIMVSLFSSVMTMFFAITIGQLMTKHKVLGSILAYIGINIVIQVISGIALVPFALTFQDASPNILFNVFGWGSMFLSLALGVLFYFLSGHILKKKVNLD